MWVAGGFSHTLCSSVDLLSEFSAVVEEEGSGFGPPLCHAVLLVWWCCVLVTVKDCISLCGFLICLEWIDIIKHGRKDQFMNL